MATHSRPRGGTATVDWTLAIQRAKDHPGHWVLASPWVPVTMVGIVKHRANRKLRSVSPPLEGMMVGTAGNPPRGDLYVRYNGAARSQEVLDYWEPAGAGERRRVPLPVAQHTKLMRRVAQEGQPHGHYLDLALRRIIEVGPQPHIADKRFEGYVDPHLWELAVRACRAADIPTQQALRVALQWVIDQQK